MKKVLLVALAIAVVVALPNLVFARGHHDEYEHHEHHSRHGVVVYSGPVYEESYSYQQPYYPPPVYYYRPAPRVYFQQRTYYRRW